MTNGKYKSASGLAAVFPTIERATKQSDTAVESALRSGINAYLSSSLLGMDNDTTYTGLNNVNKILQEELYNSFVDYTKLEQNKDLDTKVLWEKWVSEENGYFSKFNELDKLYSDFYKNLKIYGRIEEYNDFMANANSYNIADFET